MSAPTQAHEFRVRALEAASALAGFGLPLGWGPLRPDVCRIDGRGGLLLGDAKDTETPGNEATRLRWARYVRRAHHLLDRGYIARFAMVVCSRGEAEAWKLLLTDIAESEGLEAAAQGIDAWGEDLHVSWVGCTNVRMS